MAGPPDSHNVTSGTDSGAATGTWTFQLRSTSVEVRCTLDEARRALAETGVPDTLCDTVELILAEALNNIVEHAYGFSDHGHISIALHLSPTEVELRICDQGRAMPDVQIPSSELARLDVPRPDLPEGGWGWYLIRTLARDLHYDRQPGQNSLCISISADG